MTANHPLPPLSLYLHFPWCVRKCPYCDFNSHTLQGEVPQSAYVAALLADLRSQMERAGAAARRDIGSIFLGGGTPSLFDPQVLGGLLESVRALLPLAPDAEITLEANPGTIERGRFADYRAAGINRVSLGAQSFAPRQLALLGRIHAADDTRRAVEELHTAGLDNFNLDLMYGLPEQDVAGAMADVEAALALEPAHLSHYQLTLEPGTVFAGRPPGGLPDVDLAAQMQAQCQQRLAAAGQVQYEVSAYGRAGRRCRHNLNYWYFGDYLGAGAGAHGKLSRMAEDGGLLIERSWREREPRRYLARAAAEPPSWRPVPVQERAFEFMLNALRLVDGFTPALFEQRTGMAWPQIEPLMQRLERRGLLEQRPADSAAGHCWRPSALGLSFLNDVLTEFLPSQEFLLSENDDKTPARSRG